MFNKKIAMLVGACGAVLGFIFTLIGIIFNGSEEKVLKSTTAAPGNVFAVIGMIFFLAAIGFLAFYLFKKGIKKNIALGAGAGGAVLGLIFAIIGMATNGSEEKLMETGKVGNGNVFAIIAMILFLCTSCFLTFLAKQDNQ